MQSDLKKLAAIILLTAATVVTGSAQNAKPESTNGTQLMNDSRTMSATA